MHEVLVNHLGGLSLPRKSVVGLTDRPDMTLDVYHGRKTTIQQQQQHRYLKPEVLMFTNSLLLESLYPVAPRKTKIMYSFGLSECNTVKG